MHYVLGLVKYGFAVVVLAYSLHLWLAGARGTR